MAPAIIVFPDCFTALGGNQYVNSSAIGNYADYLTKEIVPFVDREFRTLASREHRGCFGKSSGGYGAIIHGMKYAVDLGRDRRPLGRRLLRLRLPPRLAQHAQRAGEVPPEEARRPAPTTCAKLEKGCDRGLDDGRVRGFLEAVWEKPKLSTAEGHAIMNLCMAATYDPDPKAPNGFRLPFNLETGELLEDALEALAGARPDQPGREAPQERSQSLRGIYIDCGSRDQYHIHYGTRIALEAAGARRASATRYEEFDDNHSDVDYRMDVSLPFLTKALQVGTVLSRPFAPPACGARRTAACRRRA